MAATFVVLLPTVVEGPAVVVGIAETGTGPISVVVAPFDDELHAERSRPRTAAQIVRRIR
jgi:hypothetical protein